MFRTKKSSNLCFSACSICGASLSFFVHLPWKWQNKLLCSVQMGCHYPLITVHKCWYLQNQQDSTNATLNPTNSSTLSFLVSTTIPMQKSCPPRVFSPQSNLSSMIFSPIGHKSCPTISESSSLSNTPTNPLSTSKSKSTVWPMIFLHLILCMRLLLHLMMIPMRKPLFLVIFQLRTLTRCL